MHRLSEEPCTAHSVCRRHDSSAVYTALRAAPVLAEQWWGQAHMCCGLSTLLSSQDATLQSGATAGRMSLQPGTCTV